MPPPKRRKMRENPTVKTELFTDAEVPEIRIIQKFTPRLVKVVSSDVVEVAGQFLSKGLINDGVHG